MYLCAEKKFIIMLRRIPTFLFALCVALVVQAQTDVYRQYIDRYKTLAISHMLRYRIPASITLAQGLLESNAGRSTLATEANNHFGIKVGSGWNGPYVLRTDDAPNEKFRKYRSVEESYEDHSLFLTNKGRYSSLFTLSPTDYKGWAHGLRAAGYATDPRYGYTLISLIERFELAQYDHYRRSHNKQEELAYATGRKLYLCNDCVYLVARSGDTFEQIAKDLDMHASRLRKCNEVDKEYELQEGDIVYLKKKQKHVAEELRGTFHKVQPGESMYSISQRYCIRLKKLYRYNYFKPDHEIQVGDLIYLR